MVGDDNAAMMMATIQHRAVVLNTKNHVTGNIHLISISSYFIVL
jgi:hypothetical protein